MYKNLFSDIFNNNQMEEAGAMSKYTSFKIGGPADLIVFPKTMEQLNDAIIICRKESIPFFVMGKGSNLLVKDNGFRGVVICLSRNFEQVDILDNNSIEATAGISLAKLAAFALENSLSGLEFASGIPGSLGGAIYMNAGAYGGEMKDVVEKIWAIDQNSNEIVLSLPDIEFGYRKSALEKNGFIVTRAVLKLTPGPCLEIKEKMSELNARRKEKQPLDIPSGGSTFKRPKGFFAAQLIDECGLKGYTIGGAMVSLKHGGFIVNYNNACAKDVLELIDYVKNRVYNRFDVVLESEIKVIGE